jgi:hypothetical protein
VTAANENRVDVDTRDTSKSIIRFEETDDAISQEGYVTLAWQPTAATIEYRLMGESSEPIYRGPLPQAFVSGLVDGDYEFHVHAYDSTGVLIASSQTPARVVVRHWPLALALSLFASGLVVFLSIVGLIILGSRMHRGPFVVESTVEESTAGGTI